MSFEEDKPMSFEEYAKWVEALGSMGMEQLENSLKDRLDKGMEDQVERVKRLGANKYSKSNYRLSAEMYQKSLIKKFLLESKDKGMEDPMERLRRLGPSDYGRSSYRHSAEIKMSDLRLTEEDLERFGYSKDGKLVVTVQLTRTRHAREIDPPSEQIDPMMIAWAKPYVYSPIHDIGIVILFNKGEFKTYTQSFEYLKHKVQQIVGNMVVVGGKLPKLPWWSEG